MTIADTTIRRRVEEVFWPLSRKYQIEESTARGLMHDLIEALAPLRAEKGFDDLLVDVHQALDEVREHLGDRSCPLAFAALDETVDALSARTAGQERHRRYLTALLATALRRLDSQRITQAQLAVLQEVVECLTNERPSFEDVRACAAALEEVGIDTLHSYGAATEKLLELYEATAPAV